MVLINDENCVTFNTLIQIGKLYFFYQSHNNISLSIFFFIKLLFVLKEKIKAVNPGNPNTYH